MVASAAATLGGAAIGALGNVVGGLASNALSTYKMMQLADYTAKVNYDYWKKQYKYQNKYGLSQSRAGIERAGYNPMLALGMSPQNASSNWSQMASPTSPDMSGIGSNAVDIAMNLKNLDNQTKLNQSQVDNYNADSVLKNSQSITELYTQLEKINHADLLKAQKDLTNKELTWYDRKQAREDLRVANEIERTGNDFKVGIANAISNQISASTGVSNAETEKQRLQWDKDKFKIYAGIGGIGSMFIPGLGYLRNAKKARQIFNGLHFIGK